LEELREKYWVERNLVLKVWFWTSILGNFLKIIRKAQVQTHSRPITKSIYEISLIMMISVHKLAWETRIKPLKASGIRRPGVLAS
jgi:hypothetical protein